MHLLNILHRECENATQKGIKEVLLAITMAQTNHPITTKTTLAYKIPRAHTLAYY
jgi:hypothetical protein